MSKELFANNASTTVGSAVGSGDTTITVATGTGNLFPAIVPGQYFTATLWAVGSTTGVPNEIVNVTARVGDTMTVVRGQEGTTAQAWSVGDTFANYPTAAFYNGLAASSDIQAQGGNSAVDTGTANAGVVALAPVITSLAEILYAPLRVEKVPSTNTGAYTLNVNGLGVKPVTSAGQPLVAGQLLGSQVFEVTWDGTNFELISTPAVIPNNQLAPMPAKTVKANLSGAAANPSDVSLAAFLASLGFGANSLTTNGYYIMPNVVDPTKPLIIQWGTYTYVAGGFIGFSWPINFANAVLVFNPGMRQTNNSDKERNVSIEGEVATLSGWSAFSGDGSDFDAIRFGWIAIGF